jgi:hypothetical protein
MASLAKVTINWTGFIGAPGYTNLYFRNSTPGLITQAVVDNAVTKVDAFVTAIKTMLPPVVTVGTSSTVDEVNDSNGALVAFWAGTPAAPGAGTMAGAYSAPSGACVAWSTSTVRNGRRIRGRTFVVPLGGAAVGTDGTIDTNELTDLRNAAIALRAATGDARLVIWARPTTPGGTDGGSAEVTSSTVQDKVAVLTSRRD